MDSLRSGTSTPQATVLLSSPKRIFKYKKSQHIQINNNIYIYIYKYVIKKKLIDLSTVVTFHSSFGKEIFRSCTFDENRIGFVRFFMLLLLLLLKSFLIVFIRPFETRIEFESFGF